MVTDSRPIIIPIVDLRSEEHFRCHSAKASMQTCASLELYTETVCHIPWAGTVCRSNFVTMPCEPLDVEVHDWSGEGLTKVRTSTLKSLE